MNQLHRAVADTLTYFAILECPLTVDELWERLHDVQVEKKELQKWLQNPPADIIKKGDLWTIRGRESDFAERKTGQKVTAQKWELIARKMKFLQKIPFSVGVCISGSVSAGNADAGSDIDLFIIARKNRIWLCRGFTVLFLKLQGKLRQERHGEIEDQLCPNHFITDDSLELRPHNIYTAHLYSQFAPVVGGAICEQLIAANLPWLQKWLPNTTGRTAAPVPIAPHKTGFWEIILTPFGALAEKFARRLQLTKIQGNPDFAEKFARGGLIFENHELRFHGRPQEPEMLQKFASQKSSGNP